MHIPDEWLKFQTNIKEGTEDKFMKLCNELSMLNGWANYAIYVLDFDFRIIPDNSDDFESEFVIGMSEKIKSDIIKSDKIKSDKIKSDEINIYDTKFNHDGDGDIRYLDRHNIICPDGSYLNSFKMLRNDDQNKKEYKYNYTCVNSKHKYKSIKDRTDLDADGSGNVIFLDRHNVDCKRKGINKFRLDRAGTEHNIRYNYTCGDKELDKFKEKDTKFNRVSDGKSLYLDRHHVKCDDDEILTQFRLVKKPDKDEIRYDYVCGSQ
jgi:hypothetical protein